MNGHDCADRKETYVTNAQHVRASSRALTVCSVILIIVGMPTLAHEVIGAIDGVTTSTAMLAVSASCVSASSASSSSCG